MVTMTDIARLSGVARSTVHAVLTHKPWVSPKTRQHVLAIVAQYHYQPNRMAASLVGRPSHLVGLILRDIMNPFNSQLVEGVHSALADTPYNTLFLNTLDRHDLEVQAVQVALGYQVDGLILAPLQLGVDLRHLWTLQDTGKPFVTLGRVPGLDTHHVRVDEELAGFQATDHLLALGHRRICCLRGPQTAAAAAERLQGYRAALLHHQVPFDPALIVQAGATLRAGHAAALEVLPRPHPPTALFCYNDLTAAGVYRAAQQLHLRIPRDLSVIGVDDIELAAVFGPPLTTIAQPSFDLGRRLAEILLHLLTPPSPPSTPSATPPTPFLTETFSPRLIQRASVQPPPSPT